jgi:hypothetical protein
MSLEDPKKLEEEKKQVGEPKDNEQLAEDDLKWVNGGMTQDTCLF